MSLLGIFRKKSSKKDNGKIDDNLQEKVKEIDDALELINQGYNQLVKLGFKKRRSFMLKTAKYFTIIASIITILFAYQQYLERNLESRIDNQEQLFNFISKNLESNSFAVRSSGIKSLSEIAFIELFKEPESGIFSPAVNLVTWILAEKDMRFLDRARVLFMEYARSKRNNDAVMYDAVSTSIINSGLNWINRESNLYNKSKNDNLFWFFYRADLSKANTPNLNFTEMMFYDVNFSQSKLTGCIFNKCYLESSNFNRAFLESSSFESSNLISANFSDAKLNFANLTKINGVKSNFTNSDLTLAKLVASNFSKSIFKSANFRTADLSYADFSEANLQNAIFQNTNLNGCNFENSDLSNADFTLAQNIDKVKSWRNAIIDGIKLPPNFFIKK